MQHNKYTIIVKYKIKHLYIPMEPIINELAPLEIAQSQLASIITPTTSQLQRMQLLSLLNNHKQAEDEEQADRISVARARLLELRQLIHLNFPVS